MRRPRHFSFQQLEERYAATNAPQVVGVLLSSTSWSSGFTSYLQSTGLGSGGYQVPTGSAAQTDEQPWTNINQVKIRFDRDVVIDQYDLSLTGVNVSQYSFANFSYDAATYTATWTLSSAIAKDRMLIDLAGDGYDPVRDTAGNALDGEWTNNVSTTSGNGIAGGDFQFAFNVLPGDVNRSGMVLGNDAVAVQNAQFLNTNSPGYSPLLDVNGSGIILGNDAVLVQNRQFNSLPAGQPAGTNNDQPLVFQLQGLQLNPTDWRFTGFVQDESPSGLTVTFGGLVQGSTTTNSNGEFAFVTSIPTGSTGLVTASTIDAQGLASNTAQCIVDIG